MRAEGTNSDAVETQAERRRMISNAGLIYIAQFCRLAVPILTLPILARGLDLDVFGALSSAQALAYLIMIIPEWGFAQGAPRRLGPLRDDHTALAEATNRFLAAKLFLCLPAIAIGLLAGFAVPVLGGDTALIIAMVALGLALGMTPGWFFQGIGEARIYAVLEILALLAFLTALLLVPFGPRDAALVLSLQAGCLTASVLIGHLLMLRRVRPSQAKLHSIFAEIRNGLALFLNKLASNGPGLGLVYIIGFLLTAEQIAYYAAAERLLMGSANALWPVMVILLPEIAARRKQDPVGADRLARRGIAILFAIGTALGAFLYVAGPLIVAILFGPNFGPTVDALRVVAFALPLIALNNGLGNGVLVARERDWLLTILTVCAALLSAVLALIFIDTAHPERVAIIRLTVEIVTAVALLISVLAVLRGEQRVP